MSDVVTLISAFFAVTSGVISAWLVFKASSNNTRVVADGQNFNQQQATIDGLRDDVAELDDQRRKYYAENVSLLQTIERYRAWGYGLVRLLSDHGIHDVPPEPQEGTPS